MYLSPRLTALCLAAGLVVSAAGGAAATNPATPAQTLIDTAIQKAKAENKAIFVHFSASW